MNELILACGSCLLAGILTTIHPCPITTNIASVSFLIGRTSNRNRIGSVIFFFVCGYLISYLLLGIIISSGFLSIPLLSVRLQKSFSLLLGPVLIFLGMILSDLLSLQQFYKGRIIEYLQTRKWKMTGAFPFGLLVSLSFCPATAAVFFGLLVPLAIRYKQMLLFPFIYALGASLPIIVVSFLIAKGSVLSNRTKWIKIIPIVSGWVLIALGIYISIKRIYFI
jgi:cytochrome c-type biogenesis protein